MPTAKTAWHDAFLNGINNLRIYAQFFIAKHWAHFMQRAVAQFGRTPDLS